MKQKSNINSAKTPLFNCKWSAKPRTIYDMLWENTR